MSIIISSIIITVAEEGGGGETELTTSGTQNKLKEVGKQKYPLQLRKLPPLKQTLMILLYTLSVMDHIGILSVLTPS